MSRAAIALLAAVVSYGFVALRVADLAGVGLQVVSVDDSSSYFVYRYEVINPGASTWGLGGFTLGIDASSGTPSNLEVTGSFLDLSSLPGLPSPEPHAPVGPITPTGWRASLPGTAVLKWAAPGTGLETSDSVAPGDTLGGFGVRSTYLPGMTQVVAIPTRQSCCSEPDTITGFYPGVSGFEVSGATIGPRYMPSEIDLDLLQSQLTTVCDDPLWIDDTSLCSELSDSLDAAEARLAINNVRGGRQAIAGARWLVENNVEPAGDVNMNAHELLRLNSTQLLTNIGWPTSNPQSQLCVWSDSEATAYFTIVASGDSLQIASPYAAEGEIEGVDPPNSSCEIVWTMPYAGIDTVDVSIRLDSVSAGSELSMIHSSGGLGMGDTISVWIGPDSLEFSHDGLEASTVVVVLVDSSHN